jgi:hypothetical protein
MNEVCREHDGNNGYVVFDKDDVNGFSRHLSICFMILKFKQPVTLTKLSSFCETRSSSPVKGDLFQHFFLLCARLDKLGSRESLRDKKRHSATLLVIT